MKSRLDQFEIVRHGADCPFLTLSKYGITFSKQSIEALDYPAYVHLYIDRKGLQVAIQPCAYDRDAIPFMKDEAARRRSFVRWSNRSLQREILELIQKDIKESALRINGQYYADENLIIYDLSDHQPVQGGQQKKR